MTSKASAVIITFAILALEATSPATVRSAQSGPSGQGQDRRSVLDRAVALFEAGNVRESVTAFDDFVRRSPADQPYLWQRGIAQYYAGQFNACRAQFEAHRLVNPDDVENAAWHFLCVARGESVAAARAALLPVGPDSRVPMREVYQMFRGAISPEQVLAAAGGTLAGQFYANLYVGLFSEATGDRRRALAHLQAAADRRFADAGGYMHMVARVHLALLPGGR
jgi:lipoprotein NlpI